MSQKTESSISLPQSITLTIRTNTPITSSNLGRFLIFRNFADKDIKLKFTLNTLNSDNSTLVITDFPDTTHNLQVLGSMNHRSYWDKIYLANGGGSTEIDIQRISLTIHYVKGADGSILDIPLLEEVLINQVLGANDEIFLTPYIATSVMKWAGIDDSEHPIAVTAAMDIGKSGTSSQGFDEYGDNPKYRGWLGYECSEFVSWYIHKAYASMLNYNGFTMGAFKDITFTGQIHEKFEQRNRSYFYHLQKRGFHGEHDDEVTYSPKAGDILLRRGNNRFEHSMILLHWDTEQLKATVIDGPYVITLREVNIHELESRDSNPKDFIICEV